MTDLHGIPVTTSTLALNKLLQLARVEQLGLVTPYTPEINSLIQANYASIGYPISDSRAKHLSITENHVIASIGEKQLTTMVREVVEAGADAVTTFCTNWNAAHLVEGWEKEFGMLVFDSVACVVWDLCRVLEVDTRGTTGWGKMFF